MPLREHFRLAVLHRSASVSAAPQTPSTTFTN